MSLELKAVLPTTNRHFRSIRSNKQMTKNVITFLMSFVIHGNSTLKAVRGLFELLRLCQEKEKKKYFVCYPNQQIHKTHTHTHTHTYIYIYIYIYIYHILYNAKFFYMFQCIRIIFRESYISVLLSYKNQDYETQ